MAIPFPTPPPQGGHIIGQPFTIVGAAVPMNLKMTCNCAIGDAHEIEIKNSIAAVCPGCRKTYNAMFNPSTLKVEMHIGVPEPETKQ